MSFDEGSNHGMTSSDDFRAKYAVALEERGVTFKQMCERAKVPESIAMAAIERGTYGLPATMNTHIQLLQSIGLDITYLLSAPAPLARPSLTERRRAVRTLAWDFSIRREIPRSHRRKLANYCASLVSQPAENTFSKAARHKAPRTTLDVAYIYQHLAGINFFSEEQP